MNAISLVEWRCSLVLVCDTQHTRAPPKMPKSKNNERIIIIINYRRLENMCDMHYDRHNIDPEQNLLPNATTCVRILCVCLTFFVVVFVRWCFCIGAHLCESLTLYGQAMLTRRHSTTHIFSKWKYETPYAGHRSHILGIIAKRNEFVFPNFSIWPMRKWCDDDDDDEQKGSFFPSFGLCRTNSICF